MDAARPRAAFSESPAAREGWEASPRGWGGGGPNPDQRKHGRGMAAARFDCARKGRGTGRGARGTIRSGMPRPPPSTLPRVGPWCQLPRSDVALRVHEFKRTGFVSSAEGSRIQPSSGVTVPQLAFRSTSPKCLTPQRELNEESGMRYGGVRATLLRA